MLESLIGGRRREIQEDNSYGGEKLGMKSELVNLQVHLMKSSAALCTNIKISA